MADECACIFDNSTPSLTAYRSRESENAPNTPTEILEATQEAPHEAPQKAPQETHQIEVTSKAKWKPK